MRDRKWIPTGGEAQLRRDAVIGASATRVHPWWRGAIDSGQGNARRVIRLASHGPAHVRYSNAHGKKNGLHPIFAAGVPGGWCSMGGLRNTDLAFQMVAVANVGGGWATSGRTGLWVSEPWLSIWKLFAGNCGGDKFSDYRSLQSFSFGRS